jgi:hypothetical protein
MISMPMMQAMAIHPRDWTYIDRERVIHDRDEFYEPLLIVERTMSDSHVKNIGQIQPAKKPAKDKISAADQHSSPKSQMSWGEIHTSQQIQHNDRIAREIVDFQGESSSRIQAEIGPAFNKFFSWQSLWGGGRPGAALDAKDLLAHDLRIRHLRRSS